MMFGLTFDEFVELKRTASIPKHQLPTVVAQTKELAFPMTLVDAAEHIRRRGYACRPETLKFMVQQKMVEPVNDRWLSTDVEVVCDYLEKHKLLMPYVEKCRVFGFKFVSYLRAMKGAAERETDRNGIDERADEQLFVMHRIPPREEHNAIISFTLCADIRDLLDRGEEI